MFPQSGMRGGIFQRHIVAQVSNFVELHFDAIVHMRRPLAETYLSRIAVLQKSNTLNPSGDLAMDREYF